MREEAEGWSQGEDLQNGAWLKQAPFFLPSKKLRFGPGFPGILAIKRLGKRPRETLQFAEMMPAEKIGVAEPAALQTALEKRHALLLRRKILK